MGACRDKALDLVGRRPHFRGELQQKLLSRGFSADEVEESLVDLERLGLLDDAQFARDLAKGSMARKGFGPRRIRFELQRKGVEEAIVDSVVAEAFSDPLEEERRAIEVVEKRSFDLSVEADRVARHLDRKGFSKAVILRVLERQNGE